MTPNNFPKRPVDENTMFVHVWTMHHFQVYIAYVLKSVPVGHDMTIDEADQISVKFTDIERKAKKEAAISEHNS